MQRQIQSQELQTDMVSRGKYELHLSIFGLVYLLRVSCIDTGVVERLFAQKVEMSDEVGKDVRIRVP